MNPNLHVTKEGLLFKVTSLEFIQTHCLSSLGKDGREEVSFISNVTDTDPILLGSAVDCQIKSYSRNTTDIGVHKILWIMHTGIKIK